MKQYGTKMMELANDSVCVLHSESDEDDSMMEFNSRTNKSDGQHHDEGDTNLKKFRNEVAIEEIEMCTLLDDVDSVCLSLRVSYPDIQIDPNMIFEQLELIKWDNNRIEKVVKLLGDLHASYVYQQSQREQFQLGDIVTVAEEVQVATNNIDTDGVNVAMPAEHDPGEAIFAAKPLQPDKEVYNGLLDDVQRILEIFPDVNGEEVYAYLEARRDELDRVQNVIEELIHRNPLTLGDSVLKNDDASNVKIAEEMFNDFDSAHPKKRLKIDSHSEHPISAVMVPAKSSTSSLDGSALKQEKMDVEVLQPGVGQRFALPETLQSRTSSLVGGPIVDAAPSVTIPSNESQPIDLTSYNYNVARSDPVSADEPMPGTASGSHQQLSDQFQVLKDTFPDADPDHLYKMICEFHENEMQLQKQVADMLESKNYPKLKDRLEKERKEALKLKFSTKIFTPEEVLQWFDDPLAFFYDTTKPISRNYETHSHNQLCNAFRRMLLTDIKSALLSHHYHYIPALRELQKKLALVCESQRYRRRKLRALLSLPEEPDELFYKELAFSKIEDQFRAYLEKKADDHKLKFEEAKKVGQLLTCNCCFDDENLLEDMIDCGSGHLFCKECVRRGAEVAVGQGHVALECMTESCTVTFPLQSLQSVLKANVFSNLLRKIQAEEISKADIPDLVQCPYCSFAAIMPDPEDKVFRCLNPECFKETCRFCKEPNHVPLRCNEVEKSDEVKMRTYIENKMTDALLRECNNCKRRFMKEEGCNKMTCVCGASMCYVCRQPIKDYSHFQNGGCPQMSNTDELHRREVITGAEKAKQEYVEKHPELKDTELKHDPMKGLPNGEHSSINTTANIAHLIDALIKRDLNKHEALLRLNWPQGFAGVRQQVPLQRIAAALPRNPNFAPPPPHLPPATYQIVAPRPPNPPPARYPIVAQRPPNPPTQKRVPAKRKRAVPIAAMATPKHGGAELTNVGQATVSLDAPMKSVLPNPVGAQDFGVAHLAVTIGNRVDWQKLIQTHRFPMQPNDRALQGSVLTGDNQMVWNANKVYYVVPQPVANPIQPPIAAIHGNATLCDPSAALNGAKKDGVYRPPIIQPSKLVLLPGVVAPSVNTAAMNPIRLRTSAIHGNNTTTTSHGSFVALNGANKKVNRTPPVIRAPKLMLQGAVPHPGNTAVTRLDRVTSHTFAPEATPIVNATSPFSASSDTGSLVDSKMPPTASLVSILRPAKLTSVVGFGGSQVLPTVTSIAAPGPLTTSHVLKPANVTPCSSYNTVTSDVENLNLGAEANRAYSNSIPAPVSGASNSTLTVPSELKAMLTSSHQKADNSLKVVALDMTATSHHSEASVGSTAEQLNHISREIDRISREVGEIDYDVYLSSLVARDITATTSQHQN